MNSTSAGSSQYRVHSGPDIVPPRSASGRSRGTSRHKADHLVSYGPTSGDYNLYYESRGYPSPVHEHSPYENGHTAAIAHHNYPPPSIHPHYPPSPGIPSPYPGYATPSPHPSHGHHHLHQSHSSSTYSAPQSHSQYPPAQPASHSHSTPHTPQLHTSHSSELSQYSLSRYKPNKPRFRIEQEGLSLVVLPPGGAASPTSVSSPPPNKSRQKRWPPSRYQTDINEDEAQDLIANGAPKFRGELKEIPSGPRGQYHFFVIPGEEWDEETDTSQFQSDSFGDMSSSPEGRITDALERPAMGHVFGTFPGTVTLACYVAGFGSEFKGSELSSRGKVRKITMIYLLDRLRTLQVHGIEEDMLDLHEHLYTHLLHDQHKYDYPQATPSMENQVADLVAALCRPTWVDFSKQENQTVAEFLTSSDPAVANTFFHQLLLAVELYLRTSSRGYSSHGKPLSDMHLPEKIRWDLMLAQRWLENVEIEAPKKVKDGKRRGEQKSSIAFTFPNKKNQIEALRNFAWTLKWPNMPEVEWTISDEDSPEQGLEDRSSNCMSWFTGLLLPGKSMPFILMNALVDCDPDTPKEFQNLQQTESNIGFQYRGATYWSWECIVGKVLGAAAGVTQIAGWIGPCSASADLERSEVAKVYQAPPKCNRLTPRDIRNMQDNSDPIGPRQDSYPVSEYHLIPEGISDPVDNIRIERLNFSPSSCNPKDIHRQSLEQANSGGKKPIITFDASVTFAITLEKRARSWKVSLRHDTPFIAAYPCQYGPHVLFCEYAYQRVRVDELVDIQNWGASGGKDSESGSDAGSDVEEVLVIDALGVPDNEVFARAWCSFWGLPSVTADLGRTCAACAIREAYAALVSVVILVDRQAVDVEVEEVDRLMENLL